ncbi:MAG: hypothetical protein H7287_03305 [Thermoleophilia bacterium]|nr:hypothetical protein [Thermoleophilia bacterium]
MNELRAYQAGKREANLRAINERVVDAIDSLDGGAAGLLTIICECALDNCAEMLVVPRAVLERARSSDIQFIVATGHVLVDIEHGVEHGDRWILVAKRGVAAASAAEEA